VEKRTKLLNCAAQEFAKYGFEDASEQPWLFGVVEGGGSPLSGGTASGAACQYCAANGGIRDGVCRARAGTWTYSQDLPDDLLFDVIATLDQADDTWLLARWEQLDRETIARISDQTVDAMRRVVASEQTIERG
jgi:hypothetical protein